MSLPPNLCALLAMLVFLAGCVMICRPPIPTPLFETEPSKTSTDSSRLDGIMFRISCQTQ